MARGGAGSADGLRLRLTTYDAGGPARPRQQLPWRPSHETLRRRWSCSSLPIVVRQVYSQIVSNSLKGVSMSKFYLIPVSNTIFIPLRQYTIWDSGTVTFDTIETPEGACPANETHLRRRNVHLRLGRGHNLTQARRRSAAATALAAEAPTTDDGGRRVGWGGGGEGAAEGLHSTVTICGAGCRLAGKNMPDIDYMSRKIGSLERINSMRETNGSFDSST